jgi:hypothetical protein
VIAARPKQPQGQPFHGGTSVRLTDVLFLFSYENERETTVPSALVGRAHQQGLLLRP